MDIFSVSYGMFSVVFAIVENISFGEWCNILWRFSMKTILTLIEFYIEYLTLKFMPSVLIFNFIKNTLFHFVHNYFWAFFLYKALFKVLYINSVIYYSNNWTQ